MPKIGGHPSCLQVSAGAHAGPAHRRANRQRTLKHTITPTVNLINNSQMQIHVFGLWKGAMTPGESPCRLNRKAAWGLEPTTLFLSFLINLNLASTNRALGTSHEISTNSSGR